MKPGRCTRTRRTLVPKPCRSRGENRTAGRESGNRKGMGRGSESSQRLGVRRTRDAAFGEDRRNVAMRCDIERGMRRMNVWSDANTLYLSDLRGRSLFDGDLFTGCDGKIKGGNRRGNVKRHVMFARKDSDLICADLVGGVTVGGDAVSSGHNRAYVSGFQEMTHHVVGNQGKRDVAAVELPCCEARTLQVRTRFRNKNVKLLSLLDCDLNHAKR